MPSFVAGPAIFDCVLIGELNKLRMALRGPGCVKAYEAPYTSMPQADAVTGQ